MLIDAAHVLPVLFSFTTPAKFCYRAMATFTKYVTGMLPLPPVQQALDPLSMTMSPTDTISPPFSPISDDKGPSASPLPRSRTISSSSVRKQNAKYKRAHHSFSGSPANGSNSAHSRRVSLSRALSAFVRRNSEHTLHQSQSTAERHTSRSPPPRESTTSSDVAGPRFHNPLETHNDDGTRTAGEVSVYANGLVCISSYERFRRLLMPARIILSPRMS